MLSFRNGSVSKFSHIGCRRSPLTPNSMEFNNGSSISRSAALGGDLSHLLVKIHRQIQRNLPSDPEVHEDIKAFMSTDRNDTMNGEINNAQAITRQELLLETYQEQRKAFNRCQYMRNNISKVGLEKLDRSEKEFAALRGQLNLNDNMSQLASVIEHVKTLLEERR